MIQYSKLKVAGNEKITDDIFKLILQSETPIDPCPGQFVAIDCSSAGASTILRRPFSIYKLIDDSTFEILFRVRGKGTKMLSGTQEGDTLKFLGPLGKSIDIVNVCGNNPYEDIVLIGGGMGIVPIMFLAQALACAKYRRVSVHLGFNRRDNFSKQCVVDTARLIHWSHIQTSYVESIISDDNIGTVVDVWENIYGPNLFGPTFVCGPELMMKYFHDLSKSSGHPCYCFMERRMGCGIGVCMSCNIGDRLTCTNGPCFKSTEVFK